MRPGRPIVPSPVVPPSPASLPETNGQAPEPGTGGAGPADSASASAATGSSPAGETTGAALTANEASPVALVAPPGERSGGCTTAQLRRFIKSRAYVPIHEIRRRFLIATEDDDVTGIELGSSRVFVGLPPREGQMLGELLRAGEVGYELQLDPVAPVVVGVYPMRPVSRG